MRWYEEFDQLKQERFGNMAVQSDVSMASYTTIRIGGPARRMAHPCSAQELVQLLDTAEERDWPWMLLGNGSDLLVSDDGLDMLVIRTDRLDRMENIEPTVLRAEAGVSLARLACFAEKQSLTGLEFAHGIPGTLGGAVLMNAGAYGGEMCQVIREVHAWFPKEGVRRLTLEELDLSYRHSLFSATRGVVLDAVMELSEGNAGTIRERMEELMAKRRDKQPLNMPSAGSTFKRPENGYAAALIDECGLKGLQIGGAKVSEKHAGFVVNAGGATCNDVLTLIREIQKVVMEKTGVLLEPEVRFVP